MVTDMVLFPVWRIEQCFVVGQRRSCKASVDVAIDDNRASGGQDNPGIEALEAPMLPCRLRGDAFVLTIASAGRAFHFATSTRAAWDVILGALTGGIGAGCACLHDGGGVTTVGIAARLRLPR